MIRRIVTWLVSQGVDDLVLNLHHRPELTAVLGDGSDLARWCATGSCRDSRQRGWSAPRARDIARTLFLIVNAIR